MDMRNARREEVVSLPSAKRRRCNGARENSRTVEVLADKKEDRKLKVRRTRRTLPEQVNSTPPVLSDDDETSSPVHEGCTPVKTRCRIQRQAHQKALQELNAQVKVDPESNNTPTKFLSGCQGLKETIKSLHNAVPSSLLCREKELATLSSFLKTTVEANMAGSLYVSGPPGTGKTACITHLLENYKDTSLTVININCMDIQRPQAIFNCISSKLLGEHKSSDRAEPLAKYIVSAKKMILLVLDEIDQLVQRGQEVLYTLFEWPSLPGSKVVLIGIANSLDFTDRFLPRLQTHLCGCHPQLLQFRPYTKDEITSILLHRLGDSGIIDPKAIEFCARKVSAVFGDLRKALDLCRRAVELAQAQERSQHPGHEWSSRTCIVTMKEMATVVASDTASSLKDDSLPLQQKLVVCTLVVLARGKPSREVTLARLQDAYKRVCERRQLKAESEGELVSLCSYLETIGIVSVKGNRSEPRLAKITLKLQESEVEQLLKDKILLSTILSEGL